MNATLKAMTVAAMLVAAGTATAGDKGTGQLVWDCGREGAPSIGELRQSFGINNLQLASQTRIRLASRIAGACQRGVEQVILVERLPSDAPATVLAAR